MRGALEEFLRFHHLVKAATAAGFLTAAGKGIGDAIVLK
jgi:hypothetical protein